jgi:maltose-binding protein MalE
VVEETTTTDQTGTSSGNSDSTTTEPKPTGPLLIWADSLRAPVVEAAAQAFTAATGSPVTVELMEYGEIRNNVADAAPAGEGPDLFIGAHDWTGELARAGVIAPLNLQGRDDEFFPVTIDAFTYEGNLYGLPLVIGEVVGLFYNKALVPEPPGDFEALRATCDGLGYPTADGAPCLAIPVGEPFHEFPFLAGFGGYIFGFENGTYDVTDVGLDSAGAIEGATFLNSLYRDGYADGAVDYSAMADLFNQGAVPFMWTGPWQVEAVEAAGIDYGVAQLPAMGGTTPRSFVGVQGFFLNSFSENATQAETFLLEYIASTETMVQLSAATSRPPALRSAFDATGQDPNLVAFAESGIAGIPLPNIPETDAAWELLGSALLAIGQGFGEPSAVMADTAQLLRAALETG